MKKALIAILAILTLYSCEKESNDISIEKSTEISSPSRVASMNITNGKAFVVGHYYWNRLCSYDNTGNSAPQSYTMEISSTQSLTTTSFAKETFNLTSGWKFTTNGSTSYTYEGITGDIKVGYEYHTDLAHFLEKSYEAVTSASTTNKYTANFAVGPNCKLSGYQLIFETSFGKYSTPTVVSIPDNTTAPEPVPDVTMEISFTEEIMGLEDMLDNVLLTIIPGSENKMEWAAIRNNIVENKIYDDHTRLYNLLLRLQTTTPGSANKAEWALIRQTCTSIISNWNTVNRNILYRQLLARFKTIVPGKANRLEWKMIRDKATYILDNTTQIW